MCSSVVWPDLCSMGVFTLLFRLKVLIVSITEGWKHVLCWTPSLPGDSKLWHYMSVSLFCLAVEVRLPDCNLFLTAGEEDERTTCSTSAQACCEQKYTQSKGRCFWQEIHPIHKYPIQRQLFLTRNTPNPKAGIFDKKYTQSKSKSFWWEIHPVQRQIFLTRNTPSPVVGIFDRKYTQSQSTTAQACCEQKYTQSKGRCFWREIRRYFWWKIHPFPRQVFLMRNTPNPKADIFDEKYIQSKGRYFWWEIHPIQRQVVLKRYTVEPQLFLLPNIKKALLRCIHNSYAEMKWQRIP